MESSASQTDIEIVTQQLGHKPRGLFRVFVRDANGAPVVIQNWPRLFDGTPMPTLYWLTGPEQIRDVGRIESAGGVDQAEAEIADAEVQAVHDRYAYERNQLLDEDVDEFEGNKGPRPSGGVAGTRRGVKCLHAHYAYYLAGGKDPVGEWVATKLRQMSGHP